MPTRLVLVLVAVASAFSQTVNYSYDSGGRIVSANYGGGVVIVYTYDGAGHLVSRQPLSSTAPFLTLTAKHQGNFTQWQNGTYTVTVSNGANAGPASGTVTVTETVPSGLTLVAMAGVGWSCTGNTCSRSDGLNSASSYPAITVTVNVAGAATSPQVNAVSLTGSGSASSTNATDSTIIIAGSRCDLNGTGQVTVADVQTVINMALGLTPATTAAEFTGGVVNVIDVQVIINVVLGVATCPD